jgi:DNA repair exonuclease SbcCD ATPase subunit
MSLNEIRERLDREFSSLRSDLKRVESAVAQVQRATELSRDARVQSAAAHLREIEWKDGRCPVCGGASPEHAPPCALAAAIAALRS